MADDDRFCWTTALAGDVEHAATDKAQVTGRAARKGRFLVAPIGGGPWSQCGGGAEVVLSPAALSDFDERITEYRRSGWEERVRDRRKPLAEAGDPEPHTPASAIHPSSSRVACGLSESMSAPALVTDTAELDALFSLKDSTIQLASAEDPRICSRPTSVHEVMVTSFPEHLDRVRPYVARTVQTILFSASGDVFDE